MDHVELLAEIGKEQNFTIVYVEFEELSKKGRQVPRHSYAILHKSLAFSIS